MFKEYKKSLTVAVVVLLIVILGISVLSCFYTKSLFTSLKNESDTELITKAKTTVGALQTHIQKPCAKIPSSGGDSPEHGSVQHKETSRHRWRLTQQISDAVCRQLS